MKFIANENFPGPSVLKLREQGLDILSIAASHSGISDFEVIQIAKELDRIILMFDSDYGEIIFRHQIENPPAVVFLDLRELSQPRHQNCFWDIC